MTSPNDTPKAKIDFPKWETKVEFGIYLFQVDGFTANKFSSLTGRTAMDPIWETLS